MDLDNATSDLKENDSRDVESYFEPIVPSISGDSDYSDYNGPMDKIELQRLALASQESHITLASTPGAIEKQTSLQRIATGHPRLDPSSNEFDGRAWVRWFLDKQHQAGTKPKPHGVTFKNLNVSGFGPSLRYMETVLSALLKPFRLLRMNQKAQAKAILHGMNGSLRNGEMLLVLGRPGAGCSTLLKTISNELSGLKVAEDSTIHYSE